MARTKITQLSGSGKLDSVDLLTAVSSSATTPLSTKITVKTLSDSLTTVSSSISASYAITASYAVNGGVTSFNTRIGPVTLQDTDISGLGVGIVSSSTFSSPSQGTLRATINGVQSDVDLGLQTTDNVQFGQVNGTNAVFSGTITAQSLKVLIVSSSIIYSSGSNIFGDELSDTQQLTGSVKITGSLSLSSGVASLTSSWAQNVQASGLVGDIALGTQTSGDYVATITAGGGLTGTATGEGSNPTIAVGTANNGIIINADNIELDTASTTFTGGVKSKLNADGVVSSSAQIDHNSTTNYVANQHIDHSTVTLTAGAGLSGGGDITANRTFDVVAGSGISVTAPTSDAVNIDTGSAHFTGGARKSISVTDTTGLDGINLEYDNSTGVLTATLQQSASYALTASYALNAAGSGNAFPYTGSAQITGSLGVTGSFSTDRDATINTLTVGRGGGNIASNTAFGSGSLVSNTTGATNVAVGNFTLRDNTEGFKNTAIGVSALKYNVGGSTNTAIGYAALRGNIAGYLNIAIGESALCGNTTGRRNIGVGNCALQANTSGKYNTAIGNSALRNNITGFNNTAIGYRSLCQNTSGYSNTAIGHCSLFSNTTGCLNTAIGEDALICNTIGYRNVAIGVAALRSNTYGHRNVAIGQAALICSSGGGRNIAVGFVAGCCITTGKNNVIIGSYTGSTAQSTQNNNIFISDGEGNLKLTLNSGSAGSAEFGGSGGISVVGNSVITGSLVVSGSNGGGVFSQGATLVDYGSGISNSGSYMVWRAPFSCSVVAVYGYREGGGPAKVNAARSGSSGYGLHASADISLTDSNTWVNFGSLQNTTYNSGDALKLIMSGSASNNQLAVQVDFIRKF